MSTHNGRNVYEYPDSAGYPDGAGFLDEGTAALVDEVLAGAVRDIDRPSADSDSEIEVHRDDLTRVYTAMLGDLELASLRYDEADDRIYILTTSVLPLFRGRGIAADLIAYALEDIRDRGLKITVYCKVVAAFISANPEYADLVQTERSDATDHNDEK
jgi:predicted GNAT family acetyltransferase